MTSPPRRTIAWFRRDLRLADNRMLELATRAERAWPVFVADPDLLRANSSATGRVAWFDANLNALDSRLREHGSGLTILRGRPEEALPRFAASVDADVVIAAADEDPRAIERDARVAAAVDLTLVDDQRIVPPDVLRTAAGQPYTVYTPFRRALDAWITADPDAATARADFDPESLAPPTHAGGGLLPDVGARPGLPAPGEQAANDRLRTFLRSDIAGYRVERDRPDLDATSRLSPYLRVGAISNRACWRAALNARQQAAERDDVVLARGSATWQGELGWREFFAHALLAHPRLATESFRTDHDTIAWVDGSDGDDLYDAWRSGRTGYPFVDAGMRQLVATGWMHNRARLVTASFLVKDLGIDWRRGESAFAELLLDADVQQNNGNWQWVAGVGMDAAPYFRIFNPTLQGQKFDPDGAYVRRWIPELADLPAGVVHEPWRAADTPGDYPPPIVDHAEARERTLSRYRAVSG